MYNGFIKVNRKFEKITSKILLILMCTPTVRERLRSDHEETRTSSSVVRGPWTSFKYKNLRGRT